MTCPCGRELTEEELGNSLIAGEYSCNACLDKWAEATFRAEPFYLKVMLPQQQGNTNMLVERVWLKVLTGDTDAGTGIIDNKPVVCEWVKYGDKVTYEDIYPDQPPYAPIVTAVIPRQSGEEC